MVSIAVLFPLFEWMRYLIVRLFILFGILSLCPAILVLLLEPVVFIIRTIENLLPSSSLKQSTSTSTTTSTTRRRGKSVVTVLADHQTNQNKEKEREKENDIITSNNHEEVIEDMNGTISAVPIMLGFGDMPVNRKPLSLSSSAFKSTKNNSNINTAISESRGLASGNEVPVQA